MPGVKISSDPTYEHQICNMSTHTDTCNRICRIRYPGHTCQNSIGFVSFGWPKYYDMLCFKKMCGVNLDQIFPYVMLVHICVMLRLRCMYVYLEAPCIVLIPRHVGLVCRVMCQQTALTDMSGGHILRIRCMMRIRNRFCVWPHN